MNVNYPSTIAIKIVTAQMELDSTTAPVTKVIRVMEKNAQVSSKIY